MSSHNKQAITEMMDDYADKWVEFHGDKSQTELFREIVPIDQCDFTGSFERYCLGEFFTGSGLKTEMMGNWNCNHLHRDIHTEPTIIIYNDEDNTVVGPLGNL